MKAILLKGLYAAMIIVISVACVAVIRPDLFRGELARKSPEAETVAAVYDPITQFRMERDQLRSMQISELDDMINSENTTEDMRKMAEEEKLSIIRRMEIEETIGSILSAEGFQGAAACADGDMITILIYSAAPTQAEIASITEQTLAISEISAENIKIIPIN